MKDAYLVLFGAAGVLGVIALAYYTNLMFVPMVAILLGMFLLGYAAPSVFEGTSDYAATIWLPIGIVVAGLLGMFSMYQNQTLIALTSPGWCGLEPCLPLGLIFISIVLGTTMNWAARLVSGDKLDLLGPYFSEEKEGKHHKKK